ncbi:MAG: hypothetical protein ABI947_19985 [Chloroflexota bacterium]
MNPNKITSKGWASFLRALPFSFVVNEPLIKCAEVLAGKHELRFIGSSHIVKIEVSDEKAYRFSVEQPRRIISIKATGYLTGISGISTQISGEISSDFTVIILSMVFAIGLLIFAVLSVGVSVLCVGLLGFLIFGVGVTIELISQYYAKLSLYTFIKRAFEVESKNSKRFTFS